MLHDLSRQLRRLMKEATRSNLGQRPSSRSLSERNVIRFRNIADVPSTNKAPWRSRLLINQGARMHATSVERGDGCAIAVLDRDGVVHAWHDSLPGAATFDLRIIGTHVSQFYLPQDVTLLRPDRDLVAASLHGSNTQQRWHRRPNGSIFWAVTVIEPIHLESGELNGYSHVTRFALDPRDRAFADVRDIPRQSWAFQGAVAAA